MVDALLDRGPVNIVVMPGFPGVNLQPFGDTILMVDPNQSAHIFIHEAVHLLARSSGVDPLTFAGDVSPLRPGMSLQMESEAYLVERTMQFELTEASTGLDPAFQQTQLNSLSDNVHQLATEGPDRAHRWVVDFDRESYGGFPPGNDPPRDWREDLRRMGLGKIIPNVERAASRRASSQSAPQAGP